MDKNWKEVMDLAEKYGFIIQAYGGVAMLATHQAQIEHYGQEKYEEIQKMNGRVEFEKSSTAAKLEKLKELTENLKELTTRHIFHKMTPSTCSIPIQVFENREEWLEFARVNFAITKLLGESEGGGE